MTFPLFPLGILRPKGGFPVPEVHYWPFQGNTNDIVGGNHAVNSGAVLTTDKFGVADSAYYFNSVENDYMSATSQSNIGTVYSIVIRIKPTTDYTFAFLNSTAFTSYNFFNSNSNFIHNASGTNVQFAISTSLTITHYHDFAILRNGTSVEFYVDAVKQDTTKTLSANNNYIFDYVTRNGSFSVDGTIDFLGVYNRILTITELERINSS